MEESHIIIGVGGLLAGIVHVLSGPDHLAAIAPLVSNRPMNSLKTGLWWGIGHSSSIWIIAAIFFLMRDALPINQLSLWSEKLVGAVLIGLGLWGIWRSIDSGRNRKIKMEHDRCEKNVAANNYSKQRFHHTPSLSIGVLHGMAGSAHYLALLPALALPKVAHALTYIGAFGAGNILAMSGFSWLLGIFVGRAYRDFSKAYALIQATLSTAALAVGIFWLADS